MLKNSDARACLLCFLSPLLGALSSDRDDIIALVRPDTDRWLFGLYPSKKMCTVTFGTPSAVASCCNG